MKKVVGVVAAVVIALAVTGFVWLQAGGGSGHPASAAGVPTAKAAGAPTGKAVNVKVAIAKKTYTLTAGGLARSYEVIAPVRPLPKTAPIIFMLGGIGPPTTSGKTAVTGEMARDDFVPYAVSNQAELVYPEPLYGSWNAIGCCGKAAAKKVDDLGFLKALVPKVDPGHTRQIYITGYSNGARLAYRVVCTDPNLFDGYAMVKGVPLPGCLVRKPVTILQIASVNDPEIPYKPGDHGIEPLAVTTLISSLRGIDKCPQQHAVARTGTMTLTTWSGCAGGTRLGFAVWTGGVHSFPRPPGSVPAASQVIWSFITQTPIAPLPK